MASQQALRFPAGFLWGTATSAHQTEGGNTNNQWWAWEQEPGHVWHNERSGRACDWWQRAEDDLATAADLGQNSHRLSIEWSRIEPRQGEFDSAALDRYRRLLGRMRELGLEPMVTLHHFTNPKTSRAIATMLETLNQTETLYPGTDLVLRYQMVSRPDPAGQEV